MTALVPCFRLLLAASLLILFPVATAALERAPAWLLVPLVLLSAISCILQDYRRPRLIFACVASNGLMLVIVYALAAGIFALID